MKISIITARSKNGVIGSNNSLPWKMPSDMRFFKQTTIGHHVLVGRKTYQSFNVQLVERPALILTTKSDYQPKYKEDQTINSLEEGIKKAKEQNETELFIIGGGEIYKQALDKNLVTNMYITELDAIIEGDTFFPNFEESEWNVVRNDSFAAGEKNDYDYSFVLYEKK
ncbi:dihydrofolate reductase [Bernardetia litoralis DSM 6794]|uniref:Dihydrofolate reductase n=1 Tax=Bernardetia litoralis (strain ATCC 23117 / DSM 6794 / NBRC 15988 / NCIMB 1366 / Fx l1 / Sio-4) TaxID=880071 RepID=I4AP56_BERLS|nr:dihydrofolate reductase [Bernardetia litoralis]AFM05741.1 dihydrofolate reductase [Bernardetia litoralis DSM 6794]